MMFWMTLFYRIEIDKSLKTVHWITLGKIMQTFLLNHILVAASERHFRLIKVMFYLNCRLEALLWNISSCTKKLNPNYKNLDIVTEDPI